MASQGPLLAGAGADVEVGGIAWTDPGNITTQDTVSATNNINWTSSTNELRASSFGFSIPVGATIAGIVVEMYCSNSNIPITAAGSYIRMVIGGSLVGTGKTPTAIGAADWQTYGGASDLWGITTPTPAQINASNFGVGLVYNNQELEDVTMAIEVDAIRITVYYTEAAGFDMKKASMMMSAH